MKRLHNLVMALAMVFVQQHVQMVVKVNVKDARAVVKMAALVDVHESVLQLAAVVVVKDVLNLVLQNVL